MSLRIIRRADVLRLLDMPGCIELMAQALQAWSAGEINSPLRSRLDFIDDAGQLILMPASMQAACGAKLASLRPGNPARGLPAIQGVIMLFDPVDGRPQAVLDAGLITQWRTAAASAVATRALANPDARSHGILGTGPQARSHALAIAAVRALDDVRIWGRDAHKAEILVDELRGEFANRGSGSIRVRAAPSIEAAAACSIISCVTGAREPILTSSAVGSGTHVNLVGAHSADAREAESALMARGAIYVDTLEGMAQEAGDVLIPQAEGLLTCGQIRGELGALLNGQIDGRREVRDLTIYKSLGFAAQDVWLARHVLAVARRERLGQEVDLDG